MIEKSINIGVPVHTAIVSKKEYVGNNALGKYGVSGAHVITSLD